MISNCKLYSVLKKSIKQNKNYIIFRLKGSTSKNQLHSALNGAIGFGPSKGKISKQFLNRVRSVTLERAKKYNPYFADYILSKSNCTENVNETAG